MQSHIAKIFLLDREQSVTEVVQNLLTSAGYDVEIFSSGKEAFAAISTKQPQLIISEVDLNDESGIAFCAQSREAYPYLPVFFLAQSREPEQRLEGLRSGAIDYMTKPFDRQLLLSKVENILRLVHSGNGQVVSPQCRGTNQAILVDLQQADVQEIIPHPDVQSKYGYSYSVLNRISEVPNDEGERVSLLEKLSNEGWLEKKIYDVVKLCPNCQSFNVNFRVVCPRCHFPGIEEELRIPNSHQTQLDQGVSPDKGTVSPDSMIHTGDYFCTQCQKKFQEATVFGRCLSCGENFDEKDAKIQILYSYQVKEAKSRSDDFSTDKNQLLSQALKECELKFYEISFLRPILELEIQEAEFQNRELALVSFQVENLTEYVSREGENVARRALRNLFLVLKKFLHPLDVVFLAEHDRIEIVLRNTSRQVAQSFVKRLQSYLQRLEKKLTVSLKLVIFPNHHVASDTPIPEDSLEKSPSLSAQAT